MEGGLADWADIARRWAPSVARSESRQGALASRRGWRRSAARQPSWPVAAVCGAPHPDGVQSWLSRADGDADAVRDALHRSSMQPLGAPNGVLVLAATGLVHNGRHWAGVARQDTGTGGTVAHGPIGVLWGDASPLGQPLRDRERSVPTAWTDARERCQPVGSPEDRPCATKPPLARQRRARAFGAGGPAQWVTGDCV